MINKKEKKLFFVGMNPTSILLHDGFVNCDIMGFVTYLFGIRGQFGTIFAFPFLFFIDHILPKGFAFSFIFEGLGHFLSPY